MTGVLQHNIEESQESYLSFISEYHKAHYPDCSGACFSTFGSTRNCHALKTISVLVLPFPAPCTSRAFASSPICCCPVSIAHILGNSMASD